MRNPSHNSPPKTYLPLLSGNISLNRIPNPQLPYNKRQRVSNPSVSFNENFLSSYGQENPNKSINKYLSSINGSFSPEFPKTVNKVSLVKPPNLFQQNSDKYATDDSYFEGFLVNASEMELNRAVELTIGTALKSNNVIFWQDIPSLHLLYSSKVNKTVTHSSGIVGYTFFSRELTKIQAGVVHPSYEEETDSIIAPAGAVHLLLFPMWDSHGNACGVVEVVREASSPPFNDDDIQFVEFFIRKYKLISKWLSKECFPHDYIVDILQIMEIEQFLLVLQRCLSHIFGSKRAEIWEYDIRSSALYRYHKEKLEINVDDSGIVWEALSKDIPLNCSINKLESSYSESVDGPDEEPIIVIPYEDKKMKTKYAIVLRGRKNLPVFTKDDESKLASIVPYIILSLQNNKKSSETSLQQGSYKDKKLTEGLSSSMDDFIDGKDQNTIISSMMEKLHSIINADRCYLFVHNKQKEVLSTIFEIGVKKTLTISIDHGIVGKTFRGSKVYNITNAYEEIDFDATFDHDTNYITNSLVSVPILNNRKETIAVLQFLNKKDGKPFSNSDLVIIKIFSTFCGLIMENNVMFKDFSESSKTISSILHISSQLTTNQSPKTILTDLLAHAKNVINTDRGTLFLVDNVLSLLVSYIVDGGQLPQTITMSNGIAASAATKKASVFVNDAYHDPRFNKIIDFHSGYKTESLLAVPIFSSEGLVIGVIELINKKSTPFTQKDATVLQCIANIAGQFLEIRDLKNVLQHGRSILEISNWIGELERGSYSTPTKLMISMNKHPDLNNNNFFAVEWNGIGLFKVVYHIFNSFDFLEFFKISNSRFFTFLFRMREEYKDSPYHNWIHAIDVLQHVFFQIKQTSLDNTLSKLELLALFIAALVHDAGHDGLSNQYHRTNQTPYGILFKNLSVSETKHCTVAIRILLQDDSNIFNNIDTENSKKLWNWIIQMVLSTDMLLHDSFMIEYNAIVDEGSLNLSSELHRLMTMQLILKVANASNAGRPFHIAERWASLLYEEFWRQGDMEVAQNMPLSQPFNGRKETKIAEEQVSFINGICLPMFKTIIRVFPELESNLDVLKGNLEKWKERKDNVNTDYNQ